MALSLQKALLWVIENSPPPLVVLIVAIIAVILLLWLSYRINKLITGALSQEHSQTKDIAESRKQQRKSEQLLCMCPCISKRNATWLQDVSQNGGQPPEPVECEYLKHKQQ